MRKISWFVFFVSIFCVSGIGGAAPDNSKKVISPIIALLMNQPPSGGPIPDSAFVSIVLVSWDDLSGHDVEETPADVDKVRFEISAPDIPTQRRTITISASQTRIEEEFVIATGVARKIKIEALNAVGLVIYGGTKYINIADSLVTTGVGMVLSTDDTPPVFGGLDDAVNVGGNHVLVSWQIATDGSNPDFKAMYLIYISKQSGDFNYSSPSYVSQPGETSYLINDLAPSTTYYFVVRAMDRAGNIDTNTAQQSLTTPSASSALYVNVNTGTDELVCGTSGLPCKTVSYALSKSVAYQTINVAKGTYNAASGETFPLQLKIGTSLIGEGYWWMGIKVIQETFLEGPTPMILGADNSSVISCYLKPTAWGTSQRAIYDDGHSMTVCHCTVDGTLGPSLMGIAFSGESSLIESRVENFNGPAGGAISVWGAGNALIKGNVVNNSPGILLGASNSEISHNWVDGGYIQVGSMDYNISDVLVFRNHIEDSSYFGLSLYRCTDTEIIWNSISYAARDGIYIWNYEHPTHMVKVMKNSITHGSGSGIFLRHGGAEINDNNIVCNVGGVTLRSSQVIDLRWNFWDHDTPSIDDGRPSDEWCDGTYDICYEAVYAGTPEPVYLPSHAKGSCSVGIMAQP